MEMQAKSMIFLPGALLILLVICGFCMWGLSILIRKFGISKTVVATVLLLPALAVGAILLSLISFRSHTVHTAHSAQQRAFDQQHQAILQQQQAIQNHAEQIHSTAESHIERARQMADVHAEASAQNILESSKILNDFQATAFDAQAHAAASSFHEDTAIIQSSTDWTFLAIVAVVAMLVLSGMIGASVYMAAQGGTLQWRAVGSKLLSIAWVVPILIMAAIPMYFIAGKLVGWSAPIVVSSTTSPAIESWANDDHAATTGDMPDWVSAPQHNAGQTRVVVVSSRYTPAVDVSETTRAINIAQTEVYNEAARQIRAYFGESYPVAGNWPIPDEIVRSAIGKVHLMEKDVDGGGKIYRRYAQVNLTPQIRHKLLPQWQKAATHNRLWALCAGLGVLTLLTGTTAGYLRLDRMTDGAYRGRLKLASFSVITAGALIAGMFVA